MLEILAFRDETGTGIGVLRLAQILGRDKATVSRALATLADVGLVTRDPETLLYRIGPRLYSIAAASAEAALAREARPFIRQIARQVRETTHLTVLRGGNVLTLLSEVGPNEVGTACWEGRLSDPLRTPSGRVLISDWAAAEVAEWYGTIVAHPGNDAGTACELGDMLVPAAPAWVESVDGHHLSYDLESLLSESARIRERGFTISDEEFEVGVVAASAPVRDHLGRIVAALNVSAPKGRVAGHLDRLGIYVARAGTRLTRRLGG